MTKKLIITSSITSIITCIVVAATLSGCTQADLIHTGEVVKTVGQSAEAIAPAIVAAGTIAAAVTPGIQWPVWAVLIADIITSLGAIVAAVKKIQTPNSKG